MSSKTISTTKSASGAKGVTKTATSTSPRTWIFRGLTVVGGAMLLVSWMMPWWQAYIVYLKTAALYVRPWGVDMFLPPEYSAVISGYQMPKIFAPLMWIFLGCCVIALVGSLFASSKDKAGIGKIRLPLPMVLVGGVGVAYIVFVVVCLIVLQMRASGFYNAPLVGTTYIGLDEGHKSYVDTSFLTGYYLAAVTGPVLLVLGLARQLIVGKKG